MAGTVIFIALQGINANQDPDELGQSTDCYVQDVPAACLSMIAYVSKRSETRSGTARPC